MNPVSTVSPSSLYEAPQRLDGSRPTDPAVGSARSRNQQAERAEQPRSEVSVSISDAARARAAEELPSTQTVEGSNAGAAAGNETRRDEPGSAIGQRLNLRA